MYKKNFLDKVIFRIDYGETALTNFDKFYNLVEPTYPTKKENQVLEGQFNFNMKLGVQQQQTKQISVLDLFNKSGQIKFEVSPRWTFLEYNQQTYQDSEHLIKDISETIDQFVEQFSIKLLDRVGLRYQNIIKIDVTHPLNWKDFINPSLHGILDFAANNNLGVSRAMGHLVTNYGDSDLVFNFGIWNNDYPNQIARSEFILDYDCYSKLPAESQDSKPSQLAEDFNNKIELQFENSITNNLRDLMNK